MVYVFLNSQRLLLMECSWLIDISLKIQEWHAADFQISTILFKIELSHLTIYSFWFFHPWNVLIDASIICVQLYFHIHMVYFMRDSKKDITAKFYMYVIVIYEFGRGLHFATYISDLDITDYILLYLTQILLWTILTSFLWQ